MEQMDEFMALEYRITAFEFMLLFEVATGGRQTFGPMEPVWAYLDQKLPWSELPYLPEHMLQELALQQRMVGLGLMEMHGNTMTVTQKGHEAVNYWLGALEEMGFKHETLSAGI